MDNYKDKYEYKKEYTLEQQSILIHFQANEKNKSTVCLRASEVKPKLDRFIVKKLGEKKQLEEQHKDWIQAESPNGTDLALRYRMIVTRINSKAVIYSTKKKNSSERGTQCSRDEEELPNIFYANMGTDNPKHGIFFTGGLKLTIICYIPKLLKQIDELIAEFFAVTNFGTMQDKGFGSFIVEGGDVDYPKTLKENYSSGVCLKIDNAGKNQKELFNTVKQVYSVMKSGQNMVGKDSKTVYIRSFIYVYMHKKHKIGNEKAFMKKKGIAPIRTTHPPEKNVQKKEDEEYRYVRALLGIGEKIEWLEPLKEQGDSGVRKEIVSIKDVTEGRTPVERAFSPIFFKIIGETVYICADNPDKRLFGRTFRFENKGYKKVNTSSPRSPLEGHSCNLETLSKDEGEKFNMADFLKEFMAYYNRKGKAGKFKKFQCIKEA